ncbi:MAG: molybdopterin dinucleotide binding domain-containing protein [bacterium]
MREVKKGVCDFCLQGCRLGVSFDGYQYRIEYLTDEEPNYGRLCPRGNSANIVIDHPKRLSYPLLDGKEITWAKAFEIIKGWLGGCRADEIAVVYSRGLTEEEFGYVSGFASALGTPNLVCGYLDPDKNLADRLEGVRPAKLPLVLASRATLLVGDVFSTSPVIAKSILEARYADRQSRLVVIDSIKTRQAGFAQLFIQTKPGTEYLALAGIAAILNRKLKIDVEGCAAQSGVGLKDLDEAARVLKGAQNGLVGAAVSFGRVYNPLLHSLCAQLVALALDFPFAGFAEALVPKGRINFRDLKEKIAGGQIRMVFWFGGLFPYSYPEVMPELGRVSFRVATSIFRFNQTLPGLLLPVPCEFEKNSRGRTLWGEVERKALAEPVSGSRFIKEIVQVVAGQELSVRRPSTDEKLWTVQSVIELIAGSKPPVDNQNGYLLLGERRAIGIGEFFDDQGEVTINPADAERLGVGTGDFVVVKSKTAEQKFWVKVSLGVPAGVLTVGADAHKNRRLFSVEFDEQTGEATIPPTRIAVWRAQA